MIQAAHRIATQKQLSALEVVALAFIAMLIYGRGVLTPEFHPDETFWIVTSTRLDHLISRDFSSAAWPDGYGSSEIRPVPSYVVAIGQRLASIRPSQLPREYWDYSESPEVNAAMGRIPRTRVLYFSRLPMAIISALSMVIVVCLLAASHSRLSGYVFLVLGLTSPYFLLILRRAMSEPCLLLFTLLSVAATARVMSEIRAGRTRGVVLGSSLVGLLSGLAGESKLVGLACAAVAVVAIFLALLRTPPPRPKIQLHLAEVGAIIIVLTTGIVFLAVYPFFYHDTLQHLAETIAVREVVLKAQLALYPSQVILPNQRASILVNRVFASPLGLPASGGPLPLIIALMVATIGGIYLAVRASRAPTPQGDILTVWLIASICLATPMLLTPLDWDRYYLYPVLLAFVFISIGAAEVCLATLRLTLRRAALKRAQTL